MTHEHEEAFALAVLDEDRAGEGCVRPAGTVVSFIRTDEAMILAWLRAKEGAWRYWSRHLQGIGAAHMPAALADAIERGEHRKDQGDVR